MGSIGLDDQENGLLVTGDTLYQVGHFNFSLLNSVSYTRVYIGVKYNVDGAQLHIVQ